MEQINLLSIIVLKPTNYIYSKKQQKKQTTMTTHGSVKALPLSKAQFNNTSLWILVSA